MSNAKKIPTGNNFRISQIKNKLNLVYYLSKLYKLLFFSIFEVIKNKSLSERVGEKLGFLFSYFLFVTMLYLIFNILNKKDVKYFIFMLIVGGISFIGYLIKKKLK